MTQVQAVPQAQAAVARPVLPFMLLLFVGSGCAALIYEIVWFQLLSLIVGSSAISLGVLLATFMGGMCLGSLMLSKYVSPREHPLKIYALLELGIGVFGVLILVLLPWVGGLYTAIGGPGFGGLLLRALFCAIFLLPPTVLMGATLPAISRYVEATPQGVSWMGFFYGGNIAGAVFGSLLAGFYLLRVYDMTTATFVAVAINLAVATLGFGLSKQTVHEPAFDEAVPDAARLPAEAWPVLVVIGLSGMTALGAEVVWTRLLSLMFGATTYTFSLILAAFLVGLGIGSGAGSFLARTMRNPRLALGWCQLLVMAGLAWAAWSVTNALPYWPTNPEISTAPKFIFQLDFVRALWTVLPGAILWGASFPIALAAVAQRDKDPGRLMGAIYASNTVGAIVGSLAVSLVLIGSAGTQTAQRILIAVAGVSALLILAPTAVAGTRKLKLEFRGAVAAVGVIWIAGLLAWSVDPVPGMLVARGRYMATWLGNHGDIIYVGEGMNSSMAVSRLSNGVLNYHNAGKVQASTEPQDMRLQRMLGHLATLLPENPQDVLVIGCGAGVTAGSASIDPRVKNLTIAEIEPLVPFVVSKEYFREANFGVVENPKTHVMVDDARHFLLTTHQTFDAITSDPFDPWVKGAATLYTKEFFELMKRKLNDGGVVTIFVQLYEAGTAAVKSEIATFLEVFPEGMVFGNTHYGEGYDVVLVGQKTPGPINLDKIAARLEQPDYAPVVQSLMDIGFYSIEQLMSTYTANGADLRPWLADAQVNRDRNLRLQYLAGLGVNAYEQVEIYRDMLSYRSYPENIFVGSPERLDMLRMAMARVQ